jgi:hypothetical protein
MPSMEFEPTIPAFDRPKVVHALDRAATVIDKNLAPTETRTRLLCRPDHSKSLYRLR